MKKTIFILFALVSACAALCACSAPVAKITFYNGEEVFYTMTVERGETFALRDLQFEGGLPERASDTDAAYRFSGWSDAEGRRADYVTAVGEISLYACFDRVPLAAGEEFTVTFSAETEAGRTVLSVQKVKKGALAVPPAAEEIPLREGHTFTGWDKDVFAPVTERTEFCAVYERNRYPFRRHVGGEMSEEELEYGAALSPAEPSLPHGVLFEGWFEDGDFSRPLALSSMPARPLDLYAKCRVDLGEARIVLPPAPVYGDGQCARAEFPAYAETVSCVWQDGQSGPAYFFRSAGTYELTVTATARVSAFTGEIVLSAEANVAKRPATLSLSGKREIVYGESPDFEAEWEGLLPGDGIAVSFSCFSEEREVRPPLAAGEYTVRAQFAPQSNYEIAPPEPIALTVRRRPLTVTASAEDAVYGNEPEIALTFAGFAPGEGEEDLSLSGARTVIEQGGMPAEGRLGAGDYTVRPGDFSSGNYEIAKREDSFSICKAPLTLSVLLDRTEIVYGETPSGEISPPEFVYGESEEEVFGGALSVRFGAEKGVGSYLAEAEYPAEPKNYEVLSQPQRYTVVPREVRILPQPFSAVYGEEPVYPRPAAEGFLEGETALEGGLRYSFEGGAERFSPAGSYRYRADAENPEEFPNYRFTSEEGTLTVGTRLFSVSSGKVSQNRGKRWEYRPAFGEDSPFSAEGKLVLDTNEAGSYVFRGEDPAPPYRWEEPLKFLREGLDVSENFRTVYDLDVTLNASRFSIAVPTEGLQFVYDGREHLFGIEATSEDGTVPTVRYTVNGEPCGEVLLKDAGVYRAEAEVSADNYETERCSFTVEIGKASYSLGGTLRDETVVYDGNARCAPVTASGAPGDDVSDRVEERIVRTPFFGGERGEVFGCENIVGAGRYDVSYSVSGDPNYEDVSGSFTFTVQRAQYDVEETPRRRYTYEPMKQFAAGVTVRALPGNRYTVRYEWDGRQSEEVPLFTEATEETQVVYTVSEGENYEEARGSYSVVVEKAQGTLDVSGVPRRFVYNGERQYVDRGAVSNNSEDGEIVYEHNAFTTVEEGLALQVKVVLKEGKNYTGASETVSGITVEKRTHTALPVPSPVLEEQVNRMGKTLADVPLPDGFRWEERAETLVPGRRAYGAVYNADPDNENDFRCEITFSTRREKLSFALVGGEADYSPSARREELTLADYTLTGEDGMPREAEREYVEFSAQGEVDLSVGGSYPVTCSAAVRENDYFTAELTERNTFFKWKTVSADGTLYTVEDALAKGGKAIVRHDTSFAPDESYYGEAVVPAGTSLVVPYGETDEGEVAQRSKQTYAAVTGKGFATLFLPENRRLEVKGTLIVNALRSSDGSRTSMVVGEHYGNLSLARGAEVVVSDGGTFESMGFTYGEGKVVAERGAKVTEPFAMPGWKGGAISSAIRTTVFPINQYALSSLAAETVFLAGSEYSVRASVSATLGILGGEQNLDLSVAFAGDGAFLSLGDGGSLTKRVEEESGTAHLTLRGEIVFHNLELALSGTIKFNTQGLQVPVPGNFSIELAEGAHATIPSGVALKLLPGARVEVSRGASLLIQGGGKALAYGDNVRFEGTDGWKDGGNGLSYPHAALGAAYRKPPRLGYGANTPASLTVAGEVTAEGTLAAPVTGEEGGRLRLASEAVLSAQIEEDNTPAINDYLGKVQALSGRGGVYFKADLAAAAEGADLAAGKQYAFDGTWREE